MHNFIDELNESQRAAVLYTDGPALVIAGAGSGKTRVLTYKIAYLLQSGYEPRSILALTFTNKAAREMKARIARQVGENRARYLWMGTFHSIFSRILRTEAQAIGFDPNFTIYDSSDSKSLIKAIIKEMQLDDKVYKPGLIQSRISNAKNQLVSPAAYASNREMIEHDNAQKVPQLRDIYQRYRDRCRQSGAMDFDDLLFYTYLLFRQHPEIKKKYSEQFRYVLVDEYQDTNYAQHCIVLQLTEERQQVCVVGDDAQSIYSFRGADIDNILKFTELYKDARIFKLEQNYRSTKTIVNAANSLIKKNQQQIRKEVFSEKDQGEPIVVYSAYSDVEEAEIVTNKLIELHKKRNYVYNDFAILYRTNAQSRVFEEALRKRGLPYKIYGGLSFYQRKEIKDVISYFRMTINPNDEEAFKRIINYPARGIGATTLDKIVEAATSYGKSLWEVVSTPLEYGLNINKGTCAKLQGFRELVSNFIVELANKNAYELGVLIINQSGIMKELYQDKSPENLSRQENIDELINGIYEFCSIREEEGNERVFLNDYLSEISLLTDQDTDKEGDNDKITLMTIHSAKGLEFRNVFVVGMEENLFPSSMCINSFRELEEERRLFYVALTRAEEHCFLSFAKSRFKYGKIEFPTPSRFLKDIDGDYLTQPDNEFNFAGRIKKTESSGWKSRTEQRGGSLYNKVKSDFVKPPFENRPESTPAVPKLKKVTPSMSKSSGAAMPSDTPEISPGRIIEHERFGIGEIIVVEGRGENAKATVRFQNAGEKQLLLKFARFKVIG